MKEKFEMYYIEMTDKEYEDFYDEMVIEQQVEENIFAQNCEVC